MKKHLIILLVAVFAGFSCSDKEDEEPNGNDPLIGLWHLIAVVQNGQAIDVTEEPCLQDSRLDAKATTLTLTISAPAGTGTESCDTESATSEWVNENGNYYFVENGDKQPADFQLQDDNQLLVVEIELEDDTLVLHFAK